MISFIFALWQPRHRSTPVLRVFRESGEDGSRWHWLHILFATGWCGFPQRIPRVPEPWGSWQEEQFDFATGYPMCCFPKEGVFGLWHATQIPGTSLFNRDAALAEPCGLWQLRHPFSTGLCLNLFAATPLAIRW